MLVGLLPMCPDQVTEQLLSLQGTQGLFAPGFVVNGSTAGNVDIYGYDNYPLGFNCANPDIWPVGGIPTYFADAHEQYSPTTPHSVLELQGGAFDPWGGPVSFMICFEDVN